MKKLFIILFVGLLCFSIFAAPSKKRLRSAGKILNLVDKSLKIVSPRRKAISSAPQKIRAPVDYTSFHPFFYDGMHVSPIVAPWNVVLSAPGSAVVVSPVSSGIPTILPAKAPWQQ